MGRRPKPTAIRELEGNRGHRALNNSEPQPLAVIGEPPSWFTDDQRAAWHYAVLSVPAGLLSTMDVGVLTVYAVAFAIHESAVRQLENQPLVVLSKNGIDMPNPLLAIINKQSLVIMRAAVEMGFSPASRSKISLPKTNPNSELEELLN